MTDDALPPLECSSCGDARYPSDALHCCACGVLVGTCHGSMRSLLSSLPPVSMHGCTVRQGVCVDCRRAMNVIIQKK